ncbi:MULTISPECIES: sarcosine oxidase subunit alpha family protein [unclassified Sphingomonas]|uniref:sarcosine oxidase subunit alpha family protein n=1 Tax=unclassified Sphingomonas TaxID=196159 RepID=UPI0006F1EB42|nr:MULTISPECIES: sarcosine oxidase subunit alpha family protein [unclassified Sphingomonas]KQX22623.1 glycine cleavage system protein T [Sphingomonas sp. Root1294]KQY67899.1 glycine cleavage system protein T [Sphingomonas sp. Root50]KRB88824.1 glycine cleavage system protein T [Sphingomonas sp. Root720]
MSGGAQRLRLATGGRIDRSRPLSFRFEGRDYAGYAGDTLASALLANGVRLVGRSFKYHRPRGIIGFGPEEPNALMQLGTGARTAPNLRATEIRLHDGLKAKAVNCWPSVRFDIGGVNNLASRFLVAGFYYKTFMWPHWHVYEGFIRRAAGLGKAPKSADPDRYETRFAHCDVLVVGSGPAGLAAARSAAAGGARVILVEQDHMLGGRLRWDGGEVDGMAGDRWAEETAAALGAMPHVRILPNTTVTGYFDHDALTMVETVSGDDPAAPAHLPRYRQWQVRAGRVVLATGAIERPLVFPGNDRPGVMLAGSVRHYLARYGVRAGDRALIFTNNDEAYRTAVAFHEAGGVVAAVVDSRAAVDATVAASVETLGICLLRGAAVVATKGAKALRGATIRTAEGGHVHFACDLLAMSGGSNPNVNLFSQSGGRLAYDEELTAFRPDVSVQNERSVGAAAGLRTLQEALISGHAAGQEGGNAPRATQAHAPSAITACWQVDAPGKAFVDMQNDVSADDIGLAARESFRSVEHLKRYTTLGMASDQGKTSNVNALAIMAGLTGQGIGETGTTRFRFPFVPMALGAFAGRAHGELLRPLRRLALHDRHVALGAIMEDYGWVRPSAYPQPGESRSEAEQREAKRVRDGVGIFDGSPLGKIEVRGPDAGKLLDFVYASAMSTLKVGKVRYGLMLNELGVVIDDGVCARLGEDHFLVGASSAGADRIAAWLEEWLQCEFVDYDVLVAPVTTSWSVITLTGPNARDLLTDAGTSFPLAGDAFPHMSFQTGTVGGIEARVMRVSYTGETSYEVNVPTGRTIELWDMLMRLGQRHGVAPIGIDAWNLLRLEKGYLHIGADTDGTTTPLNIGWDHVLRRKGDFAGKRSLMLDIHKDSKRLQLVGLRTEAGDMLPIGAHIVKGVGAERESDGFVTSSVFSPTFGKGVAMALVHGGTGRIGQSVTLEHQGRRLSATIVQPTLYDPEGARLNG